MVCWWELEAIETADTVVPDVEAERKFSVGEETTIDGFRIVWVIAFTGVTMAAVGIPEGGAGLRGCGAVLMW